MINRACTSSRGGEGSCLSHEACYDFSEVGWDRYADPVDDMDQQVVRFDDDVIVCRGVCIT